MKKLRPFILFSALFLSLGSSTPYQKQGFMGGYSDQQIGRNTHLISVEVNGYTSQSTAMRHAYRRAAELCPGGFTPIDGQGDANVVGYQTKCSNGFGGPQCNTTAISKPTYDLVVECH